jgi:hypothetical protein
MQFSTSSRICSDRGGEFGFKLVGVSAVRRRKQLLAISPAAAIWKIGGYCDIMVWDGTGLKSIDTYHDQLG